MSTDNRLLVEDFWRNVFEADHWYFRQKCKLLGVNTELTIKNSEIGFFAATFMAYMRARGIKKGDRVAIMAENSPLWDCADFAIQTLGAVVVPIHASSTASAVQQIMSDSDASILFVDDDRQLDRLRDTDSFKQAVQFKRIMPELFADADADAPSFDMRLLVLGNFGEHYWTQRIPQAIMNELKWIEQALKEDKFNEAAGISADDLASLSYTSGSSGTPKGCMLSHGNIAAKVAGVASVDLRFCAGVDLDMSFLPRSHVFGHFDEMGLCIRRRVPVAYSSIDPNELRANMLSYAPSVLCGVPQVLEKIYAGVCNPAEGLPKILSRLHLWQPLLKAAISSEPGSSAGKFCDRHVFDRIRARLGGKVRIVVTGGASAKAEVLRFFKRLGLEVLEGYGATETTSACIVNRPSWDARPGPKSKVGSVGLPLPGVQVRIANFDPERGGGEIQICGKQVFLGYWNNAEATAEAFSEDGWYCTGDLGKIDEDGFVFILDRLNEVFKTSAGKYVSNAKTEDAFKGIPIIAAVVMEAQNRKYPTALVFINLEEAEKLAGEKLPAGADAASWYTEQPEVKLAVEAARKQANQKLEHWEQIGRVYVVPLAANEANGVITDTKKVRSRVLRKRFARELDELYVQGERERRS